MKATVRFNATTGEFVHEFVVTAGSPQPGDRDRESSVQRVEVLGGLIHEYRRGA